MFWFDRERNARVSSVMAVAYKREQLAKNLGELKHVTIAANGVFCLFVFLLP